MTRQPGSRASYNDHNMKTIAITIDETVLARIDRVAAGNRSKVIRDAVDDYLARLDRGVAEAAEAVVLRRHRARLARQAAAAVRVQARP